MRTTLALRLWNWFRNKLPWTVRTQDAGHDETLAEIFHSEIEWRNARNAHVKDHPVCEMCGINKKIEVHHIKPYSKYPAYRYDDSNLITLCHECHFRFGHGRNYHMSNPDIENLCKQAKESLKNVH
jgi:5-methylcytosine-specific restriction endonuclease McrA